MVASRHAQTGMVKPTKPCMMTYPAIVCQRRFISAPI
jgi:hypothetical protein